MTGSAADRLSRAERAARLRASGWSLRQIAREIGVAKSTVESDLRKAPVPLRPSPLPRPWCGDWRLEATRLRAAGHPDHRGSQPAPFWLIAKQLAVSEKDVRRHFARLRRRDRRAANAAALRAGGLSLRAVAACLGVSEATIRRDLAAGTPLRHQRVRTPGISPGSSPEIGHPNDATNVIPLRRTAR